MEKKERREQNLGCPCLLDSLCTRQHSCCDCHERIVGKFESEFDRVWGDFMARVAIQLLGTLAVISAREMNESTSFAYLGTYSSLHPGTTDSRPATSYRPLSDLRSKGKRYTMFTVGTPRSMTTPDSYGAERYHDLQHPLSSAG